MSSAPPATAEPSDHAKRARQRIYDQAIALFERKGFAGTTMNDIAQACEVTKPTLYYYFRNKSHLLEVLYQEVTANFFEHSRQIALSEAAADVRLTKLVTMLVVYNIGHRRFLRIFWRERSELDGDARAGLAALERDFEAIVLDVITQGIASGQFRRCDAQIAMFSILGLLSTVQNWARFADATPERIGDEVAALVLRGLLEEGQGLRPRPHLSLK